MRSSDWSSDVCSSDLGRPAACKPNRPLPNRRSKEPHLEHYHGTTILGVKKGGKTVVAGDGQVSLGNTVIKQNARERKSVVKGKSESVRLNLGGRRIIKKKK